MDASFWLFYSIIGLKVVTALVLDGFTSQKVSIYGIPVFYRYSLVESSVQEFTIANHLRYFPFIRLDRCLSAKVFNVMMY